METLSKKLYEALFLVDSALAAADWDGVNKTIETILEKSKAEIVSIRKWDERKLAYEIEHKSRGTYLLCYFRAEGQEIQQIERRVQLSEQIMRVLVLCADHHTQEKIEMDTPAMVAEKNAQKVAEERSLREDAKELEASAAASAQADLEAPEASEAVEADTEESAEPAAAEAEVEEVEAEPEPLAASEPEQVEPTEESSPADAEEQEEKKEPEIE